MKQTQHFAVVILMVACTTTLQLQAQAGQLDATFGLGGWIHTDLGGKEQAGTAAVQKDGKILVGGRIALQTSAYDFLLLRYLDNGQLDTSFAGKGYKIWDFGFNQENLEFVRVLENGKILAGGFSGPNPNTTGILIQLLPNGQEDPDFGTQGIVKFKHGKSSGPVAAAVDVQGRIVVTGVAVVDSFDIDFQVSRFTPEGKPDSSFNGQGWMYHNFLTREDIPFDLLLEDDGKIMISGCAGVYPQANFAFLRLLEDGRLDPQFASNGYLQTDFAGNHDIAYSAAKTKDGKYLVSGTVRDAVTNYDFAMARYLPNGDLDPSFGNGGKLTYDFGGPVDYGLYMLKQKDNKFLVCGENNVLARNHYVVVRYFDDGRIDSTFGMDGIARFDAVSILTDQTPHFTMQPDGKVIMAANYREDQNVDILVIRWTNDVLSASTSYKRSPTYVQLLVQPVHDLIQLQFSEDLVNERVNIQCVDMHGKSIAQTIKNQGISTFSWEMPTADIPKGLYWLKWKSTNHSGSLPVIIR